jgi:TorA maturation chaperone TorD
MISHYSRLTVVFTYSKAENVEATATEKCKNAITPDRGLQKAIRAAGGVTELARRIGISQPSVSNWTRVPAERVVAVEMATGIARLTLRPDLYDDPNTAELDNVDLARVRAYGLLGRLLQRAPDADLLLRLAQLRGDASPFGEAASDLAAAAYQASVDRVEREFFDLFIGIGRGEIVPYASFYLTGFLHERPLARLREDLSRFGIDRAEGVAEPEDHAGILCEVMAGLTSGELPAPANSDRVIFDKHMMPWMGRLFADIETAAAARFYRHVGTVGRLFLQIESEAFTLAG